MTVTALADRAMKAPSCGRRWRRWKKRRHSFHIRRLEQHYPQSKSLISLIFLYRIWLWHHWKRQVKKYARHELAKKNGHDRSSTCEGRCTRHCTVLVQQRPHWKRARVGGTRGEEWSENGRAEKRTAVVHISWGLGEVPGNGTVMSDPKWETREERSRKAVYVPRSSMKEPEKVAFKSNEYTLTL